MAMIIITSQPKQLIKAMKAEINAGHILTWSIDKDGDFQHDTKSQQWSSAWMCPQEIGVCSVEIVPQFLSGYNASVLDFGVIQGRFSEMLIGHFSKYIDNIVITPAK